MGMSEKTAEMIAKGIPLAVGAAFPAISLMRSTDYERNVPSAVAHGAVAAGIGAGAYGISKGVMEDYAPEMIAKAIAKGAKQ